MSGHVHRGASQQSAPTYRLHKPSSLYLEKGKILPLWDQLENIPLTTSAWTKRTYGRGGLYHSTTALLKARRGNKLTIEASDHLNSSTPEQLNQIASEQPNK